LVVSLCGNDAAGHALASNSNLRWLPAPATKSYGKIRALPETERPFCFSTGVSLGILSGSIYQAKRDGALRNAKAAEKR
jgi:hypothetical protein